MRYVESASLLAARAQAELIGTSNRDLRHHCIAPLHSVMTNSNLTRTNLPSSLYSPAASEEE